MPCWRCQGCLRNPTLVFAQGGLRVGGAVSLGELVELLGGADGCGADAQSNIAAHVSRIAGAPRPFMAGGLLTILFC